MENFRRLVLVGFVLVSTSAGALFGTCIEPKELEAPVKKVEKTITDFKIEINKAWRMSYEENSQECERIDNEISKSNLSEQAKGRLYNRLGIEVLYIFTESVFENEIQEACDYYANNKFTYEEYTQELKQIKIEIDKQPEITESSFSKEAKERLKKSIDKKLGSK